MKVGKTLTPVSGGQPVPARDGNKHLSTYRTLNHCVRELADVLIHLNFKARASILQRTEWIHKHFITVQGPTSKLEEWDVLADSCCRCSHGY